MYQNINDMSAPPIYSVADTLLDSSLIAQTNKKLYNVKLIKCGSNFTQIYVYENSKIKKDNNWESPFYEKHIIDDEYVLYEYKETKEIELKEIRKDNVLRSKLSLERLIKSNIEHLKTFITLTFGENVSDIKKANKYYNIWRTRIKKEYPNFIYICVPEYQKRGAVHFHLLTNLEINSNIVYKQKNKDNMYDIKYWSKGFSSAFKITEKDINIIYYLSKYLTKNIDNRLYGHKRYFYSKNMKIPIIEFLDINIYKENLYLENILKNKSLIYENKYNQKYTNLEIKFVEYSSIFKQ